MNPQTKPTKSPAKRPSTASPARAKSIDDLPEDSRSGRFLLFTVVPSWVVSFVAHVVLISAAAFFALPRPPSTSISFEGAPPSDSALDSVDISLDAFDDALEPLESELASSAAAEVTEPTEAMAPEATVDVGALLAGVDSNFEMDSTPSAAKSISSGSETSMRTGSSRGEALKKYGGSAESESAVELALKWIVDHQRADGGWNFNHQLGEGSHRKSPDPGVPALESARNAATAMALLPLLGQGHTHQSGKHKEAVFNGLKFLLERGRPIDKAVSFHEKPLGRMYSHGLVSIVLCEAFAMTGDDKLRPFAQQAIHYIEHAQHESGGGWKYDPKQRGDTSVVGWQVMAMKSAIASGLEVKPRTIKLTKRFLDEVGNTELGVFGYERKPSKQLSIDRARTAIGLLCRMYLGMEKDAEQIRNGVNYLSELGPDNGGSHDRVTSMYYNYYATQVMKQYGGDLWKEWNADMRDFLVETQEREGPATGSWIFDEEHSKAAGRLYTTSLSCMTLEVYYRFLPLYKETILDEEFPLD